MSGRTRVTNHPPNPLEVFGESPVNVKTPSVFRLIRKKMKPADALKLSSPFGNYSTYSPYFEGLRKTKRFPLTPMVVYLEMAVYQGCLRLERDYQTYKVRFHNTIRWNQNINFSIRVGRD